MAGFADPCKALDITVTVVDKWPSLLNPRTLQSVLRATTSLPWLTSYKHFNTIEIETCEAKSPLHIACSCFFFFFNYYIPSFFALWTGGQWYTYPSEGRLKGRSALQSHNDSHCVWVGLTHFIPVAWPHCYYRGWLWKWNDCNLMKGCLKSR